MLEAIVDSCRESPTTSVYTDVSLGAWTAGEALVG